MSAQPIWQTPPGSLGTVPQGTFYEVPLQVEEPDGGQVYFQVIAGALPSGVECTKTGIIQGVPTNVVTVAQEVVVGNNYDITSKFAIRAYTTTTVNGITVINRLADRTFTLTIAGQNAPEWITAPGPLPSPDPNDIFLQGTLLSPGIQLQYLNENSAVTQQVRLISGTLPPGITLSNTGLLSGYFDLNPAIGATPGYSVDGQGFDQYEFDFDAQDASYNYVFTLQLTDGRTNSLRTFSMYVQSPDEFNASTTYITVDTTIYTTDVSSVEVPVLLNPQGSIGTSPSETFFAYQFTGISLYSDTVGFVGYDLPPGLTLDSRSGWLYGYLPDIGLTERTYDFTVRVYQYGVQYAPISPAYSYSLSITGPISTQISWISPSYLGSVANGGTSTFSVLAVSTSNLALQYRLLSGSNSKLPQGLELLPSGHIVGRVSFNTFALDNNTTTFDSDTTTFDLTYTFTVNAYSINGYVNINQTFSIKVIRAYVLPYNNIYIDCMPPETDRQLIGSLIQNRTIFPEPLLYRSDDPNFGLSKNVSYYHAYGLNAQALPTYMAALQYNHYWKNLILGPIKTARAVDPDTGSVLYEVVYSQVIDDLVNSAGQSADPAVVIPYPIDVDTPQEIVTVYPNALEDMRNRVIDIVGQESDILPLWMQSTQTDGSVLGFTPAWVIAYTIPGASGQVAYNINTQYGEQLNRVDFSVDRYELDGSMTANWNADTQEWIPNPSESTTFDINNHYNIVINAGGTGYEVGDHLTIPGTALGGVSPLNDVTILVDTVSSTGAIIDAFYSGTADILAAGDVYNNIYSTSATGSGIGAQWDVTVVPGEQTIFDGGSLTFASPADTNTNTNTYDKYLMFPRINILTPVNPYYVVWKNTNSYTDSWINSANIAIPWTSSNA